NRVVARLAVINVDPPAERSAVGVLVRQRLLGQGGLDPRAQVRFRDISINVVVDGHDVRGVIALAQAASTLDADLARAQLVRQRREASFEARRSVRGPCWRVKSVSGTNS